MTKRGNTLPEKIGPWRREDYDSFLALDVKLQPVELQPAALNRLSQLAGVPWSREAAPELWAQEQARLVAKAWEFRRAHPVYRTLEQDANFKKAWREFERRRRVTTDGKLGSTTTPFVFLREFVQFAGFAFTAGRAGQPKLKRGAYARRRDSAIKHATALRELVDAGISLDDYTDTRRLRELLQELSGELSKIKQKHYEYNGARELQRKILKGFAVGLRAFCELKSPAIMMHFASMVDLPCEESTAKRYCNEADRRYRQALADALAERGARQ